MASKTLQEITPLENGVTKLNGKNKVEGTTLQVGTHPTEYPILKHKPKLSYWNNPGEYPLLGMTVGDIVASAAKAFGDAEAFVSPFQNIRISFNQLYHDVSKMSRALLSLGLKPGDRIAIWSPNTYEAYIYQLAGWSAGMIMVLINSAAQSPELLYALNKVGVRCILISMPFRKQDYYKILTESVPEIRTCPLGQLKSSNAPTLEFVLAVQQDLIGTYNFSSLLSKKLNTSIEPSKVQFDDVCTLFFTSGTTGSPKAVMLTHHSLGSNGFFYGNRLELVPGDRICVAVPIFHMYGVLTGIFAALTHGSTLVIPSFGYDPKAIADITAQERCTHTAATPTMYVDLIAATADIELNLPSLKTVITAAAFCSPQLYEEIKIKMKPRKIASLYGMTEDCGTHVTLSSDSDELASTSVGYPLENIEVKIVDADNNIVPIGMEGELCVKGYSVTRGYWGDAVKTAEVVDEAGWFHTGDLFTMSETGHAYIVGRIKEMIIRGGENINPKEVEDYLETHPKIVDAQVFAIPDKRMGEEIAAWVQLRKGESLTQNEVEAYCKGKISHFKIPKWILFNKEIPRTAVGKVQKFAMCQETLRIINNNPTINKV